MDAAVRLIARAFENEIRECDYAGRILDDEFVLLFAETALENALSRLQKMAMRLNKLSLIWDGKEINLNLSLGLRDYTADEDAVKIFESANADLQRNRRGESYKKSA